MSFGSFLSGIYHQVVPSFLGDRQTYGSVNPPRKRPDRPVVVAPRPVIQPINLTNNIPTTRTPVSFGTLKVNPTVVVPQKQFTTKTEPVPFKVLNTGADIAANVASGFGEGVAKLAGSPLSLASLIARKTNNPTIANKIDTVNLPSKIGNSIAGARKEVDVAAKKEGVNTPYKIGSVIGSTALAIPAAAEGISKLGQTPKVVQNLPKTAKVLRKTGKAAGGEILPKVRNFFRGNPAEDVAAEAAGAGELTQIPVTNLSPGTVPIPVARPLRPIITDVAGVDTPPVNVVKPPTRLIREVGGDASNAEEAAQRVTQQANQKAIDRFKEQIQSGRKPDQRIEGVTGLKQSDVTEARNVLEDALNSKKITKDEHALLTKELDNIEKPPTSGKSISVKQVDTIPVQQVNDVPVNLPETPGKVRVTKTTDPVKAQSEAIAAETPVTLSKGVEAEIAALERRYANTDTMEGMAQIQKEIDRLKGVQSSEAPAAPAAAPTPTLPADVQAILDNPRQFNKRQVKYARNQAKLATQLATQQAKKQTVIDSMPQLASKPEGNKGFVHSGEYAIGKNGNVIERAHNVLEQAQASHDIANLSPADVLAQASKEKVDAGAIGADTTRKLKALRNSGQYSKTSSEYKAVNDAYHEGLTNAAQTMGLADRTFRATSSGDQLANSFVNKILLFSEDGGKLSDAHVAQVQQAENAFTDARDTATALADRFKATGDPADFNAWRNAQQTMEKADRQARITEYLVAKEVLKGNKSLEAFKAVENSAKNAGVYSMDSIDANMLSGTGTMFRNYINTLFPRLENRAFGRVSSLAVRKLAPVGGSSFRGGKIGSQIGRTMFKADLAARKEGGIGPIRRVVTAGNTLGEHNITATAYAKAYDQYKLLLKRDGYTGAELNNRAEFMARTDPYRIDSPKLVQKYESDALQANGLASLLNSNSKKIENMFADKTQKWAAGLGLGHTGQQVGRFGAKAVTRVGLGFPTVIARSLVEGLKRATLGIPEAGFAALRFGLTHDPEVFAQDLSKAIQHLGSGGSLIATGYALGKAGLVSGPYPSDKNERERWTAEGKQPNSIKIGGSWFQIPGYLGGFALPVMLGATVANGNVKDEATLHNAWDTVLAASPVDNVQSTLEILTGTASESKVKNAIASLVRSMTPAGSAVAEVAKMTDSTKNDTTTKSMGQNTLDAIAAGIPGVNNAVNTIPATDANGNILHNPNPVATFLGAQGAEQKQGIEDSNNVQNTANETFSQLRDFGVLDNQNLMGLVDKKIAAQIARGQDLSPEDIKSVQKAVTKGIGTGISADSDSNWRENGDYATDRSAMQVKLAMLQADSTTKKSVIDNLKTQIARDDVLEKYNIPYDSLQLYEKTSVTDWRAMGDPEDDNYDPDTYAMLKQLDDLLTDAKGSYKEGNPNKNKFTEKSSKDKKGKKGKTMKTDFGTLSNSGNPFAPRVREYQTADLSGTSNIPVINVVRPHIVHEIKTGQV